MFSLLKECWRVWRDSPWLPTSRLSLRCGPPADAADLTWDYASGPDRTAYYAYIREHYIYLHDGGFIDLREVG